MNDCTKYYVRQIVGRYHVGDTNRYVIRGIISRIKGGLRGFKLEPREKRHALLRYIVDEHARNFIMYAAVMSGRV